MSFGARPLVAARSFSFLAVSGVTWTSMGLLYGVGTNRATGWCRNLDPAQMREVRGRIEAGTGIMSSTPRVPSDDVVRCPHCQGDLSFVGSWACRGLWGYKDVRTYECPDHGPIFVSPETAIARGQNIASASGPDDGDRDSLAPAPRKPTPTIYADRDSDSGARIGAKLTYRRPRRLASRTQVPSA